MNNRDIKETIACSIALCNGACLVLIKKTPHTLHTTHTTLTQNTHTHTTHTHTHTHHTHTHTPRKTISTQQK